MPIIFDLSKIPHYQPSPTCPKQGVPFEMINKSGTTFNLADSTVFILHPNDEMPQKHGNDTFLSQYQHGNINVKNGLSVGFLFRCVKTKVEVDVLNDRLVAPRIHCSMQECKAAVQHDMA